MKEQLRTVAGDCLCGIAWYILLLCLPIAGMPQGTGLDKPKVEKQAHQDPNVTVRAWLSKTALWVGDHVRYTVELRLAPNIDILADDLSRDKIRVEGLEMLDTVGEKTVNASGEITHRFRYELASYDIGVSNPKILDIPVRYYIKSPGLRMESSIPAGEVIVPAVVLGFRSTLPTEDGSYLIRDIRPFTQYSAMFRVFEPAGLVVIMISAIPVLLWATAWVQRKRQSTIEKRGHEAGRHFSPPSLEQLKHLDASGEWEKREAYTRLDSVLRAHLSRSFDLPAQSLTPLEIEAQLTKLRSKEMAERVGSVLKQCEHARYCPDELMPGPEQWKEVVAQTERAFSEASK